MKHEEYMHKHNDGTPDMHVVGSELDFVYIMNTIGQGLLVTGDGWRFEYVNPAFARIVGEPLEDLIGKSMDDFIISEDLPILERERAKRLSGETTTYEFRLRRSNGEIAHVHATGAPRRLGDSAVGSISVVTDLTEQKKAEKSLKESERRLRNLMDSLFEFVAVLTPDGTVVECNKTALEAAKLTPEDVIGKRFEECYWWSYSPEIQAQLRAAINRGALGSSSRYDVTVRLSEDKYAIIDFMLEPLRNAKGRVINLVPSAIDITERKRAEEAYRVLVDNSLQGLIIFQGNRIVFANGACAMMVGYASEEILAMSFEEIQMAVHPEDRVMVWTRFKDRFDGKSVPDNYEFRMIRKDGSILWVEMHASLTKYQDKPAIQATIIDITERKRAEEALHASHQILDEILNAIPVRVFWKNRDSVFLGCNAKFAYDAGFVDPKDLIGKDDYQMVWRDQAELYRADDRQVIESGCPMLLIEEPQTTQEGNTIDLLTSKIPLRNSEGEIIGVLGTYMDITERKHVETALRESEAKLAAAFYASPDLMSVTRLADGKILEVNEGYSRMLGYSHEESIGKTTTDLAIWADLADRKKFVAALRSSGRIIDFETRLQRKDRSVITVIDSARTITLGGEACILSVTHDITERKRAEVALRESKDYLDKIINSIGDPLFVKDRQYRITLVNDASCRIFGRPRDEILGKTAYDLFPSKEMADISREKDEEVFRSGVENVNEETITYAPGETRTVLVKKTPYKDNAGNQFLVGITRDITDRKQAEDKIVASLQEKEVLLKEIHHRVKNNLQIISSLLSIQSRCFQDENIKGILIDCKNRVKSMALVHESLYGSENLSNVEFAEYIRSLTKYLIRSSDVDKNMVRLNLDLDDISLDITKAIPCGLIFNELVTNCLKHAFPDGRTGEIEIELHSLNGTIVLSIRDNGIGLPSGIGSFHDGRSMGLNLVESLVKQLKGTIEIDLSKGTEFRINIPAS